MAMACDASPALFAFYILYQFPIGLLPLVAVATSAKVLVSLRSSAWSPLFVEGGSLTVTL